MVTVSKLTVTPTSMVTQEDLQHIVIGYHCSRAAHLLLNVFRGDTVIAENIPLALDSGSRNTAVLLPLQNDEFDALWQIKDREGNVLAQTTQFWRKPRQWTLYAMISSHTDLGLHNSQYVQQDACPKLLDEAMKLCDQTDGDAEIDRYRYTMEGSWFWNNYGKKHGAAAAREIADNYIKTGKIGTCAGMAGNHFQTFSLEEMCRSTYERKRLYENWDLDSQTLALIDLNGMSASLIHPYVSAGYKNIIFAPNHWNPLRSTVWKNDRNILGPDLNPEAGGYGSRVDVRYASEIPMVYNWENENGEQLTVWASTQYGYGGDAFGFYPLPRYYYIDLQGREDKMWQQLEVLESKYPYDIWLFASYDDDQVPDRYLLDHIQEWNAKWKWPKVRALGNPDEPFRLLRERFGDQIPVIRGDMAGGWYQHPLTVPEMIGQKLDADRLLSVAEKWSVAACLTDSNYAYPATDFRRAWDHLMFNDEHSYGVSGYTGRKVYETWMQHHDWIDRAEQTARAECANALQFIASHIPAREDSLVVFNPTGQEITRWVQTEGGCARVSVPPFGYRVVARSQLTPMASVTEVPQNPPVIENRFYRISFAGNGAILSIFDKELGRELADTGNEYRINELVFTKDHHKNFFTPGDAVFEVSRDDTCIRVTVRTSLEALGADICHQITLPLDEKRIDIDNRLFHVRSMINARRYYRYLYYAFPFQVENCRRLCHLNGTVVEYAKDITGHGTDVYMAAQEWCCSENPDFGVALMMHENQLTEFDHIHPDKTDFDNAGNGSQIFTYIANDWLQKHTSGGSHLDYRFRYSITSYCGGYKAAAVPEQAERFVTPSATLSIPAQAGSLPADAHSFLKMQGSSRFLCLKRADDGNGIIARFYGENPAAVFDDAWNACSCTVDERFPAAPTAGYGFTTYRLGQDTTSLKTREPEIPVSPDGVPSPIGAVYTGLIGEPCAAATEGYGSLYLLWGANRDPDFSHYKLYRSEASGFEANEDTFLAEIQPEEYCVGRYVDTGLKDHACYYYRVCAVNHAGVCGPLSREFSAYTREGFFD